MDCSPRFLDFTEREKTIVGQEKNHFCMLRWLLNTAECTFPPTTFLPPNVTFTFAVNRLFNIGMKWCLSHKMGSYRIIEPHFFPAAD